MIEDSLRGLSFCLGVLTDNFENVGLSYSSFVNCSGGDRDISIRPNIMKLRIICNLILLIFLFGCDSHKESSGVYSQKGHSDDSNILASYKTDSLVSYDQVPNAIKKYLDSIEGGKFLIANPGEEWQAGCTAEQGCPRKQFIYAVESEHFFQMKFWQGGIGKS